MKPLRDRIFVLQDPEREYLGGIIVPTGKNNIESQAMLGRFGTVMAIGPDVDKDQIRIGDRICYGEFDYPRTPDKLVILSDADVCGVMDE